MGFFCVRFVHRLRLDNLDPVTVRVFKEGQRLHAAIAQAFLEINAQRFETLAGSHDIRHRNADMTKAARIGVAVMVNNTGVGFRAVVVRQLQNARNGFHPDSACSVIGWYLSLVDQREEVQAELSLWEVAFFNQRKAENTGVEIQGFLDVLDTQHGVVEYEIFCCAVGSGRYAGKVVQFLQAHEPSESNAC